MVIFVLMLKSIKRVANLTIKANSEGRATSN